MARNIFVGQSKAWLLEKRGDILDALTSTIASTTGGDSSATAASRSELRATLDQIDFALHVLDPDGYPQSGQPVTRTKADFS